MIIRRAGDADMAGILAVVRSLGMPTEADPSPGYQAAMVGETFLIAEDDGHVIGFGLLRWKNLDSLYVLKDRHGVGVGSRILAQMEAIVRQQGQRALYAHASPPDPADFDALIRFYEQRGYTEVQRSPGRWVDFVKQL